jgi:hypothetical protein
MMAAFDVGDVWPLDRYRTWTGTVQSLHSSAGRLIRTFDS